MSRPAWPRGRRGAALMLLLLVVAVLPLLALMRERGRSAPDVPAAGQGAPVTKARLPASDIPEPAPAQRPTAEAATAHDAPPASRVAAARPEAPTSTSLPPLQVPVEGVAPASLRDTFVEARAGHVHEAIDIPAARGTRVVAAIDGTVEKLFTSVPGGLTVYVFDAERQHAYYYAHLDRYADGLREGQALRRGELVGYVGSSGNASPEAPHLHFAVFRLGPERQWWKGEPIDPYAALGGR